MRPVGGGRWQAGGLGLAILLARPVAAQAPDSVPVAAHPLPRGHVLTAADVGWRSAHPAGARQPRTAPLGSTTRRPLAAGEALVPPAVAPPDVVRRGEAVGATYAEGGITLTVTGTAMNAAPLGGRVLVRVDAHRRLTGVADAPGHVRLAPSQ